MLLLNTKPTQSGQCHLQLLAQRQLKQKPLGKS
jgi:hypothetical protein